jgi:V-type H+-transporting ATPase subunit C
MAADKFKSEVIEYWFIAIPNHGNANQAISTLKNHVESRGGKCNGLNKLPLQRLKVGTLDKLIALSDELGRVDNMGKGIVQKLHKSYMDLDDTPEQMLSVYNKSVHAYISNFVWDEGHFNPRAQMKDLVQSIHTNLTKTAEHLRKWTATLGDIQNKLNAIERKKTGSLMNKALNEYISLNEWVDGEYLCTALVVVPNNKTNDFLEQYEFFEDSDANKQYYELLSKKQEQDQKQQHNSEANDAQSQPQQQPQVHHAQNEVDKLHNAECRCVVPDSQKFLTKDSEFSLFRVYLLKRGYQWFKYCAMKHGYAVRDFSVDELDAENEEKALLELKKKESSQKKRLKLFCKNTFSEAFAHWVHLKIIRAFVESVLRFGLPVDFSISVVRPPKGSEKKLLTVLEQKYKHLLDSIFQSKQSEDEIDYSQRMADFYPFIYIECKVEL